MEAVVNIMTANELNTTCKTKMKDIALENQERSKHQTITSKSCSCLWIKREQKVTIADLHCSHYSCLL